MNQMKRVVAFFFICLVSVQVAFASQDSATSRDPSSRVRDIFRPLKKNPNEVLVVLPEKGKPKVFLGNTVLDVGQHIGPLHYFSADNGEIVLNIRGIICKIKIEAKKNKGAKDDN